jgi:hypothetical protein
MTRSTTELQQQLDCYGAFPPLGRRGLWRGTLLLSRRALNADPGLVYRRPMSEKKLGGSDAARAARLAEQLRANLRRRKAQMRGAAAQDDLTAETPPPLPGAEPTRR